MRMTKKVVSVVLSVMMVVAMMSVMAFSADAATYVAQLDGGTKYTTVAKAFAAITDEEPHTVTLLADSTTTGSIGLYYPSWSDRSVVKNVTLELNGFTYTQNKTNSTGTFVLACTNDGSKGGSLTVQDSSQAQTGKISCNTMYCTIISGSKCTFTLKSGTIENTSDDGSALDVSGSGTAIMQGGKLDAPYAVTLYEASGNTNPTFIISGGEVVGDTYVYADVPNATFDIQGGTFTSYDGIITTSAQLKAAAEAGGKYMLGADVTIDGTMLTNTTTTKKTGGGFNYDDRFVVNDDFELAGNGYTITAGDGTEGKTLFYPTGDEIAVTMTGLTLDGNHNAARAIAGYQSSGGQNSNAITLCDVTVTNFDCPNYAGAVYPFGGTKLGLYDCIITGNTIVEDPRYPNANGSSVWAGGASEIIVCGGTYDQMYANGAEADYTIYGGAEIGEMNIEVADRVCVVVYDATINTVNAESENKGLPLNANQLIFTEESEIGVPDGYVVIDGAEEGFRTITTIKAIADIKGYQMKIEITPESKKAEGNDINTKGVRIITKVDNELLESADDYGYVVAAYNGNKDQTTANFANLKSDGGNGQKVVSCAGTENNIPGYGEDYVTLAVNGMTSGDNAVARFYIVIDGVTYYANYSTYGGIMATYYEIVAD